MVFSLPADDERRAGLVNQDGIHLVNNGVVQPPLHAVSHLINHVVAQIVKPVFIVGAVRYIRAVGRLLLLPWHLRQINTNTHPEKVVQLSHPLGIAIGQVVIHSDHVHAFAGKRIEVDRQSGR